MNKEALSKPYVVDGSIADSEPMNKDKTLEHEANDPTTDIAQDNDVGVKNKIENPNENDKESLKLSAQDESPSVESSQPQELSSLYSSDFITNTSIQEHQDELKQVQFHIQDQGNESAIQRFDMGTIEEELDENDVDDDTEERQEKREGYIISAPEKARSESFIAQARPSLLQAVAKTYSLVIFGRERLHDELQAHRLSCAKSGDCSETSTGFSDAWHRFMEKQMYLMNLELEDDDTRTTHYSKNDAKRKEESAVVASEDKKMNSSTENKKENEEGKSVTENESKGFFFRQAYLMNLELDADIDNTAATDSLKNEAESKEESPVSVAAQTINLSTEKKKEHEQNFATENEQKGFFFMSSRQMFLMEQEIDAVKDELAASQRVDSSLTSTRKESERQLSESSERAEHEPKGQRLSISQMASMTLQTVARQRRILQEELFSNDEDLPSWYDSR